MLRTTSKLLLMALTACGLAIGLLVDIAIARTAGATSLTDNLVMALTIPFVIDTVLREGARYSIISIIHEREDSNLEAEIVAIAIFGLLSTFILAVAIFRWPLADAIALHKSIFPLLLASGATGIFAYSAFLSAVADANNYFVISSSRNAIVHATALSAFLLLKVLFELDVLKAVLAAYLSGAAVYAVILTVLLAANGVVNSIRFPSASTLRSLRVKFVPSLINVGAGQGMRVAERGFLLPIAGGGVFLFYIGFRIFASLQALIGGTLATLAMRRNKELLIDLDGFKAALRDSAKQAFFYAVPCVLFIFFFGRKAIEIAYGKKLTESDVEVAFQVLKILSVVIYFQALNVIVTTFWLTRRRTFLMNVVPTSVLAISVPAFWFFSRNYGIVGVAGTTAAAVVVSLFANLVFLYLQISAEEKRC